MNPALFFKIAYLLLRNFEQKNALAKRCYNIAGYNVCINFTAEETISLIEPAFEHLRASNVENPDLTIYLADHLSLQTPLKIPDQFGKWLKPRGEIEELSNEEISTSYNHHDGSLSIINFKSNIAIYWVRSVGHMPWWVAGSPLQRIIAYWMRRKDLELTHAAAVGLPQGGVLFAGKSGSGKSTSTLACMESGLFYASEDYCLTTHVSEPYVHSVYNSAKLEPNTVSMYPHFANMAVNTQRQSWEKLLIFHSKFCPNRILNSFPLKAILVLQITSNENTIIKPCSKATAVMALAASTIFQLTGSGQATLRHFAELAKKLPCHYLMLGSSQKQLASVVSNFIEGVIG